MQRFIVLYRAPQNVAQRFARATPEEAQQGMQLWIDWAHQLGPALLDPGKPLGNAMTVQPAGVSESQPAGAARPAIYTVSFLALCLATVLGYSQNFILQPVLPLYVLHLGGDAALVGAIVAAFSLP